VKLPPLSLIILDTETTGFLPKVHRVIELAVVRCENGESVETYEQLFAIDTEIPPHVEVLTRIRTGDLAGKPTFADQKNVIETLLTKDAILVGQNLGYDLSMIKGEGIDLTDKPWIDTSLLASLVFPELKSYSLAYLSATLKLRHDPAHRAMGDVRATMDLLSAIWERLGELPQEELQIVKNIMARSTSGYRMLFEKLESARKKLPVWFVKPSFGGAPAPATTLRLLPPAIGTVDLKEESLHPDSLPLLIAAAASDTAKTQWIAVKNLESTLRKIPLSPDVQVLYPSALLLDPEAMKRLAAQEKFTAEEALLATKIVWFDAHKRSEIALHGGERDVWYGKMACTEKSPEYTDQFKGAARTFILDHRQLLEFLEDPAHAAHGALTPDTHIVIDDASMLEDTATKAYGHQCALDELRAAAEGNAELTRLVDVASLWAEKTRMAEDQHMITAEELGRPETKGLRQQIIEAGSAGNLQDRCLTLFKELAAIIDPKNLRGDIRWIETRPNGSLFLHSAPEYISLMLKKSLYDRFPTTLIVPKESDSELPEVLHEKQVTAQSQALDLPPCPVAVSFRNDLPLASILENPPAGRTVILASSKRGIEHLFVKYTEALEAKGITMICQGLSGGQGRMEAEFLAAKTPVLWLLTPWMYEGIDLLEGGIDHLVIESVPFDHPGYPVFQKRKSHYKNSFEGYALPRVEHRLFRLLRTFCRHRTEGGDVTILDTRLKEKSYGARLMAYTEKISGGKSTQTELKPVVAKTKKGTDQPSLF